MKPLLSFVIPSYNYREFVVQAIGSAFNQELPIPSEVVVVDDASTDGTWDNLLRLAHKYGQQLRLFPNATNLGGGATRNRGIQEARGNLIYMLDADDLIPLGMVLPQLHQLTESGLDVVSVEKIKFFSETPASPTHEWTMVQREGISGLEEFFSSFRVPASHAGHLMFTRRAFDTVGGFDEQRGAMDAWTFGLKLVLAGFPSAITRGTYYYHRVGHESYWTREQRKNANNVHAIAALRENLPRLPAPIRDKITLLRDGDPFFDFLEDGVFLNNVPLAVERLRVWQRRWRRQLVEAAARLRDKISFERKKWS